MSVIKRIYSYTGKARAPPRGECCPSVVSMFPTRPVQGPQNHKTYESISYSFCDFCPERRQPCVICYQSNVHFLLKCTPSNMLLLLMAASSSSRLHLFSLISKKEALHFPVLHWLLFHYFPFFFSAFSTLSLSWPSCLLLLSPPPFTWFPAWYICLPSPCIPSFPSHHLVLVSFQLIPSLPCRLCKSVTLHFCLLKFFRQFSSHRMQYLAIFLNSSLVAVAGTPIRNMSYTAWGSHTARCKPGLLLQLRSRNRITE